MKQRISWNELEKIVGELVSKINLKPDIIIGVVRGGIVPARLLSNALNVKKMYCINVEKVGEDRKVRTEILDDIDNKNVLLVEDMLETGRSLIVAKEYLEKKGALVKTACFFIQSKSEIKPDYYLKRTDSEVSFPWE